MLEISVYEAIDGTRFNTKEACMKYEDELSRKEIEYYEEAIEKVKRDAKKLRKMMLPDDFCPLNEHNLDPDSWYFTWFKVNNDEEVELLNKYLDDKITFDLEYPTYICVESEGVFICDEEDDITIGQYVKTLDNSIKEAKWFFEHFGLTMELKEND